MYRYDAEQVWIEPWGPNALRVRATKGSKMPPEDWALQQPQATDAQICIADDDSDAPIINGRIKASISKNGRLMVWNSNTRELVLEE